MVIYVSQGTLAQFAGISRKACNEALRSLQDKGFIAMNYRHMTSNIYKISSIFHMEEFRKKWASFLPALSSLFIGMLSPFMFSNSVNFRFNQDRVTRLSKEKNFIYNNTTTVRLTLRGKMSEASKEITVNGIQFTQQQQEQLQQFPPSTITYAKKVWFESKDVVNPGGFFLGVCRKHTDAKGGVVVSGKGEGLLRLTNTPSGERDVDDLYKRKNTSMGKTDFLPSFTKPQPQSQVKIELNPVEEYYRAELLRETPKYKRAIDFLGYHPENPFIKQMKELGLSPSCDPTILDKMRQREKLAHASGSTRCIFNKVTWGSNDGDCPFSEIYCPTGLVENEENMTAGEQNYVL